MSSGGLGLRGMDRGPDGSAPLLRRGVDGSGTGHRGARSGSVFFLCQ